MSVVLSVEETGPCEKKLEVEVPAATVEAETVRIAVEFRKQAKLPGFRKGKVPMEMVRKRFGEDIDQEVLDRLLPRYWRQAEAEVKLEALLPPTVDDVSHEAGKALVFKATVEVRPEFGLDNLEGFDLPSPPTAVTDEEVERMLEDLRRSVAPWVETERSAAHGDLVEATLLEVEADGSDGPQPVTFEVGDPNVWEELTLEVTGKKGGQSGAFSRSHEHEGETHIQEFQIDLTAVKERDLLPLDDELAAKIGKFSTLDKLRADISKRIGSGKALEARRMREQALLDQLRERNPTTLPKRVLDNEIRQMLTDYADGLGARGVDPSQADIDWQQLSDQVRPQAEARVHARLLLDAVAELFALEVSEEVFEATLARLARSQGKSAAQLRRAFDSDGRLAELRAQLRREGALKRLLGDDNNGPVESPDLTAVEEE
ncbi:MAG: trigger factor [Acidobacteria bacterium]|nr:trigger factor [Acidobacteriota bacterium]